MILARRSFLSGIIAAAAAPVIVRAGSIMPVKVMPTALAAADDHEVHLILHTQYVDTISPGWLNFHVSELSKMSPTHMIVDPGWRRLVSA